MKQPKYPDINILSVHEELEVEQKFYQLQRAGYVPLGLEDAFLRKMLMEKAIEVELRIKS